MPDASLLEWIAKYGITGFAVIAWWLERSERIATQKALQQLIPDGLKAMTEVKNAIRALRFTLFNGGRAMPPGGDDEQFSGESA